MKREIYAVHDLDLEKLLTDLGLFEALTKGEVSCSICGCKVTMENLGFVYPHKQKIYVCCEKMVCYQELMKKHEGG